MENINNMGYVQNIIRENSMILIYFSSNDKCSVCTILKDKISTIAKKYYIKAFHINIDTLQDVSGEYNVFTVPTTLFYIDGKEVLREGRYISLVEFEQRIKRYYNLYN